MNGKENSFQLELRLLSDKIISKLDFDKNFPPRILLINGPSRTNTTGLSISIQKGFSQDQRVVRHIQPIKAYGRKMSGIKPSTPTTFFHKENTISLNSSTNIIKESIGPNLANPGEWLDSLDILIRSGIPESNITFIPTLRDPIHTAISWQNMWEWPWAEFPFSALNQSFLYTQKAIEFAKSKNILVAPYIHEFIRDYSTNLVMLELCKKAELPYSPNMLKWGNSTLEDPYFSEPVVIYDLPPEKWISGSLSTKRGGLGGLIWKERQGNAGKLTNAQNEILLEKLQPSIDAYLKIRNDALSEYHL